MSVANITSDRPPDLAATTASLRTPIWWGVVVGILQAFSPVAFWWVDRDLIWALGLVVIGSIYIGFAVADGRRNVIIAEITVASGFIVLALVAITTSPWLVVIGLVAHGMKDLWQHRSHFVANTRWWPPFCLVVDFVAATAVAILLVIGVDFYG
jgi:hypothetical protein